MILTKKINFIKGNNVLLSDTLMIISSVLLLSIFMIFSYVIIKDLFAGKNIENEKI